VQPLSPFEADLPATRIVFGVGAVDLVGDEVDRAGITRLLLIAGGSAEDALDRLRTTLGSKLAETLRDVRQHVPEALASSAVEAARSAAVDGVLAVGGGSAIGLGKVVAVDLEIPLLAVPTTYSGSEMTPVYGTTGERKVTRRDLRALPSVAIYDPTLTTTLPPRVTATSGLNALAHCMEAIAGPGATPPSALAAREASSILPAALRACVRDGDDVDARAAAQYGGFLAGRALALAGTGLQHKLAHILGGRFGLVHAEVHSVLLPRVAAYREGTDPGQMATFAGALGSGRVASETLDDLATETGAPRSLEELGLPRDAIDVAVRDLDDTFDRDAIGALLENAFLPMIRGSTEGGAP
jgi:maleylacetate reductase